LGSRGSVCVTSGGARTYDSHSAGPSRILADHAEEAVGVARMLSVSARSPFSICCRQAANDSRSLSSMSSGLAHEDALPKKIACRSRRLARRCA